MAVIVNGDGILTGVSSLTTALDDLTSGRGTITGVTTVGTLQLGAGVSISSPRSQNAAIFTNNSEFLTIDDAGRIGVGTISPNTDAHPQNVGKINVGFITARSVAGDIDANTLVVAGLSTFTDDVTFKGASANVTFDKSDNSLKVDDQFKIKVGNSGDLEIHHNGNHSVIADVGTGNLQLRAADFRVTNSDNTATMITGSVGGNVVLYNDNTGRLNTNSTGITVTNRITGGGDSNTYINVGPNDIIDLYTGGTNLVRMNANGNIGINNSNPQNKLLVTDGGSTTLPVIQSHITNSNGSFLGFGLYSDINSKFTFTVTNNGRVAANDGIIFGSDTANANLLDDYEEGSFTPALVNGTGITVHNATYIKIGTKCTINVYVTISTNSNSSTLQFNGLPFTEANKGYALGAAYTQNTGATHVFSQKSINSQNIEVLKTYGQSITLSDVSGAYVLFSNTYFTV